MESRPRFTTRRHEGSDLLMPGALKNFASVRSEDVWKKLNFLSLMLALFCGTAALPHILIRYYTVKDQASAAKLTIVGIASIGVFYVLTLILGLGAMTSGALDPTNVNMASPLLAKSFSNILFAVISAIAFTTVLGTVSGLIMAGSVPWLTICWRTCSASRWTITSRCCTENCSRHRFGNFGNGAWESLQGFQRRLPRRLGRQYRGLGQSARAGDAAFLEATRRPREFLPRCPSA